MSKIKGTGIFDTFWTFWYETPLNIFKFFRDRIGELSFACFINYVADDYVNLRKNVEHFKRATLAEFFVVPPVLLFNYEPNIFKLEKDIYDFICQNAYLRSICDKVYELKTKKEPETPLNQALEFLANMPPFSFIYGIIQIILNNPYMFFVEWTNQINNIILQHDSDIIKITDTILKKFTVDIAEQSVINLSKENCLTVCPILPYLIPDLIAKIKLIGAYESVKPSEKQSINVQDIINNLLARIYCDNKKIAFKTIEEDNKFTHTVKKQQWEQLQPEKVTINVFGLIKERPIYITPICEFIKQNFDYGKVGELVYCGIGQECPERYIMFDIYGDWDYYEVWIQTKKIYEGSEYPNCVSFVPMASGTYTFTIKVYKDNQLQAECRKSFEVSL